MKKFFAILLSVLLCMTAVSAFAETFSFDDPWTFSLDYPDDFLLNDDNLETDEEGIWKCGFFYGPGDTDINFSVRLYQEDDYTDLNLNNIKDDEDALDQYATDVVAKWWKDKNLTYFGSVSNEYGMTFVLLSGSDEYGPLVIADSMNDGWDLYIEFYAYADDNFDSCRDLNEVDVAQIVEILQSVKH